MEPITGSRENQHPQTFDEIGTRGASGAQKTEAQARSRQKNAAAAFRQAARQLDIIASDDDRTIGLMELVYSIPNEKTRAAAFEALGFDEKVADGLAYRCESGLARFDSRGVANVRVQFADGQYGPTQHDMKETLQGRAREIHEHADNIEKWSRVPPAVRRAVDQFIDAGLKTGSVGADVSGTVSFFRGSSNSLIGGASVTGALLTTAGLLKTESDWSAAKKVALTPAMTLTDLERARAGYMNGFGKGLVQLMLMGLPGGTVGCEILDLIAGEPDIPRLPSWSLAGMLDAASMKHSGL